MNHIYLIGFMGTGKSSVSKKLGKLLQKKVFDTDDLIVENEKKSIPEIFAEVGEDGFRSIETENLKKIAAMESAVISCGGGIILKDENIKIMKESGSVVLLTASPETVLYRVKFDDNRPLLKGRKTVEGISELMEARQERYSLAKQYEVSTDHKSVSEIAQEIIAYID